MNILSSECSSGCESGWTSYLEQSFCFGNLSYKSNGFNDRMDGFCEEHRKGQKGKEEVVVNDDEEEEEEDLSMISDASSGPPHFNEDNGYLNETVVKVATLKKNGSKSHRKKDHQQPSSLLDDTASSPLINFSKNNFGHANTHASMEESAFHSPQGGPAYEDQFGLLQPSPSGNHPQGYQWF